MEAATSSETLLTDIATRRQNPVRPRLEWYEYTEQNTRTADQTIYRRIEQKSFQH
jgi:hypothetical protein